MIKAVELSIKTGCTSIIIQGKAHPAEYSWVKGLSCIAPIPDFEYPVSDKFEDFTYKVSSV